MPGPYDVSSKTKISELDLTSLGLELTAGPNDIGRDIEFNDTGSAMFILMSNDAAPRDKSYIHHFRLGTNYDVSTATFVGYQLTGFWGAVAATIGIFLPSFLFVLILNPLVPKMRRSKVLGFFLDSVNVASVSVMAGVLIEMSKISLLNWAEVTIAIISFLLIFGLKKISSMWIVLGSSFLGFLFSLI